MPEGPHPGLERRDEQEVTEERTATHLGSGALRVYATPAMALFVERTCMALIQPQLPEGRTTVGTSLQLRHTAPTPLGGRVSIRVELVEVDGDRLRFSARLWDADGQVGEGEHSRHVVDRDRFLERVRAKAQRLGLPASARPEAAV